LELFVLRLALALVLPPALVLVRFMFEPFMLPAFEFDMFEFDAFEFDMFVFMFEFDAFEFDMFVFMFELLALLLLALLEFSAPPQAASPATPANARSAKVLRIDRSPELL
jgi:hypothetical protein